MMDIMWCCLGQFLNYSDEQKGFVRFTFGFLCSGFVNDGFLIQNFESLY